MQEAVLAAAVTGRLVPQDPNDTPAAKLLADLDVDAIHEPTLAKLPSGWEWSTVGDVGVVDLGRQRHPDWHTGPNMKPYLRVANVFEDRIDTGDVKQMHFDPKTFERFKLVPGDVLLNEGQTPELLGRPAMYRGNPPDVAFTNSILRFKARGEIRPEWALLVFRHHMHSGRFTRESRITTNIAHISAGRLKPVEFPVPPAQEQERIVTEVERQFSFVEACDRAAAAGLARSVALRRSVLKAAFRGRLVSQDPSDEPASVLLGRIRTGVGGRTRLKKPKSS
jgi:type I restriction enzyme S subunit